MPNNNTLPNGDPAPPVIVRLERLTYEKPSRWSVEMQGIDGVAIVTSATLLRYGRFSNKNIRTIERPAPHVSKHEWDRIVGQAQGNMRDVR